MSNRRVCTFFLEGNCRFGDRCKFAHPADAAPRHDSNSGRNQRGQPASWNVSGFGDIGGGSGGPRDFNFASQKSRSQFERQHTFSNRGGGGGAGDGNRWNVLGNMGDAGAGSWNASGFGQQQQQQQQQQVPSASGQPMQPFGGGGAGGFSGWGAGTPGFQQPSFGQMNISGFPSMMAPSTPMQGSPFAFPPNGTPAASPFTPTGGSQSAFGASAFPGAAAAAGGGAAFSAPLFNLETRSTAESIKYNMPAPSQEIANISRLSGTNNYRGKLMGDIFFAPQFAPVLVREGEGPFEAKNPRGSVGSVQLPVSAQLIHPYKEGTEMPDSDVAEYARDPLDGYSRIPLFPPPMRGA